MRIDLFLKEENGEERAINTYFNLSANPFKLGDIINLSVKESELLRGIYEINDQLHIKLQKNYEEERNLFHLKKVKLIEENKYIELNNDNKGIIIEYFCKFVK